MSLATTRVYGIFPLDTKPGDPPVALIDAHTPAGALSYHTANTLLVRQPTPQEIAAATKAGVEIVHAGRIDGDRASEAAGAAVRG